MAINPQPRENLLLEATAYGRRLLLRLPVPPQWLESGQPNEIASFWCREFATLGDWELFVGWRKNGGWSVYFQQQPVLQFNSQHQLRRLYAGGERFSAEMGRLKRLERNELGGQVRFGEQRLDTQTEQWVLASCQLFLSAAADLLGNNQYTLLGQFPPAEPAMVEDARVMLAAAAGGLHIAKAPHAAS